LNSPLAFIDGAWVEQAKLAIPIYDAGFVLGATVTEQLRTFHGKLFRLDAHLDRLLHSLSICRIDPGHSRRAFGEIAAKVIAHNYPLLADGDDLGMGIFVTPGVYAAFAGGVESAPTVCAYSYPLPFELWASKYRRGETVVVSDITQVPASCWPPALKCRSRMHYFLADRQAHATHPGARAILLDAAGHVCETSTANVVMFCESEGLVSPRDGAVLPGISLLTLAALAAQLGIPYRQRDIEREELVAADELILTSTSVCMLPVVCCDGWAIGGGVPGKVFQQLLAAWSTLVGVDIEAQAARFADRRSRP